MIDHLHVIFHKCRVGTRRLTFAQKASHPVAWTSCPRRGSNVLFRPTDRITMRTGERALHPIPAATDPLIGRYFQGIPTQFAGMMDVRDLGEYSYEYHTSGQVATMYAQCDASPVARRLEANTSETTTAAPRCKSKKRKQAHAIDYALLNEFPELDYTGEEDGHVDIHIVDKAGNYLDADAPRDAYCEDEAEKKVVDWYEEALNNLGGDSHENMMDMERQACMYEEECLGGVEDYSPEFKAI
ncbi:hypothetical protein PsorP6_006413 [Peronosclerospora sorghi]|uniref:Uncharacterized protein n=1 Tax=Peronosclerospora sorghi TaxID=230839 RepID=A0ACC0W3N5_9STRA|nr:hypothetical protein PsorP6_006413 [Peronosclerospora sorghi]